MFDPFFGWLESTALSVWIVESPSLFAFPGILAAHTIGLGLLAGLNAALDLRLLGVLTLIVVALLILRETLRRLRRDSTISGSTKVLAAVSLVLWAATIAAGRLLAYTCTRLTVTTSC